MNVNAQKLQSQNGLVCKSSAWSNHRTTLPQSALAGCQLPQRGSRERSHSSGYSLKSGVTGDFHRPYATQKPFPFTIHRTTLPQSALRAASSLREGAGKRPHSVNHPPAGCFVSGRVIFGLCVGGDILPFNRVLAKPEGFGRFSSPLRNSKDFGFYHSTKDSLSVTPVGCAVQRTIWA